MIIVSLKTSGKDVLVDGSDSAEWAQTAPGPGHRDGDLLVKDPDGKVIARYLRVEVAGWRTEDENRVPRVG